MPLLHQPLHSCCHANALRSQLPQMLPAIRAAILRVDGADMNQKCFVAKVPAEQYARVEPGAHGSQRRSPAVPALPRDRQICCGVDKAYFIAGSLRRTRGFPRMSRSIVTRANSARRRCSPSARVTRGLPLAPFKFQHDAPDPIAQGLLNHPQLRPLPPDSDRLNKPRRLLLELKRVTSPLRLRHLRHPFALEQLAKDTFARARSL